jgi:hypothetical protein
VGCVVVDAPPGHDLDGWHRNRPISQVNNADGDLDADHGSLDERGVVVCEACHQRRWKLIRAVDVTDAKGGSAGARLNEQGQAKPLEDE